MIFVAMPSMWDLELFPTIYDILNKADYPNEIVFGIRYVGNNDDDHRQYQDLVSNFKNFIRSTYVSDTPDNLGVGRARKGVAELYDGENYILSIDSHMLFPQSWDTLFVENLHRAKQQETGNDKTILTAYGARYHINNGEREYLDKTLLYPFMGYDDFIDIENHPFLNYKLWEATPPWMVKTTEYLGGNFLPTAKFSYHLAFSDEMFLYDEDEELIIMEEDICKTLKLFNDGWDLVHPLDPKLLTGHLYVPHAVQRHKRKHYNHNYQNDEDRKKTDGEIMKANVERYVSKYQDTAKLWESYTGVRFGGYKDKHNRHIPTKYFQQYKIENPSL